MEVEKALKLAYDKASAVELARTLTGLDNAAKALNQRRLFDAVMAASRMKLQPLSAQADPTVAADCSGSVHAIYSQSGLRYRYTETARFAAAAASETIPFRKLDPSEAPRPGDVVFYPSGHMSIYAGAGTVWSAHKAGYNFARFPVGTFGRHVFYRYQQ